MRRWGLLAMLALVVGTNAEHGRSAKGGSVLFDRTYSCTVPPEYPGGGPVLEIRLGPRRTTASGTWGGGGSVRINQGGYSSPGLISFHTGPIDTQRPVGWLIVSATRCTEQRRRTIPLAPKGLPGPPTLFEQGVECPAARRVLVRLRARLDRAPRWRRNDDERIATVNFSEAVFAVRTDGVPARAIAFGDYGRTGRTKFFAAPTCD